MYPIDKLGKRCLVAFCHCCHTMHPLLGILKVETYPPDFLGHATRKMSLIYALDILMKSCRFCSCKPKPKQQVEQEQDVDRINDWFGIQCNTEGLQIDKAGLYT